MAVNDIIDVIYMAHPVGQPPHRDANIERAKRWFHWLVSSFDDVAIMVPWLPYVTTLDESPTNRTRGIRDDLQCLKCGDGIVAVGGVMSPGMQGEMDLAADLDLRTQRDWTWLGIEPPPVLTELKWREAYGSHLRSALERAGWSDPAESK